MKICVIENEQRHIEHLNTLLKQWENKNEHPLSIDCYHNGDILLAKEAVTYDVIFLDIQLDNETGIEIAKRLREKGYSNEIIFLTAYKQYVFEGYNVRAMNYLLKPAQYEQLDNCLQYIKKQIVNSYFQYRYKEVFYSIPYKNIIYFSSNNHYVEIVTTDMQLKKVDSLKNILSYLPDCFVPCHRTLIVNIQHVQKIQKKELFLSNDEILPISNTYLKQIKEAFLKKHF